MVPKVLLVDPDVEALASLAQALRRRGLKVQIANGTQMACERAKATRYDAVLAWHELAETEGDGLGLLDALAVETGRVPPFFLIVDDLQPPGRKDQVQRGDIEEIFNRIALTVSEPLPSSPAPEAAPQTTPAPPPSHRHSVLTGYLSRTSLRDLLLALSIERRTGTLAVTTSQGAGELRLHDGELVDAVYLRLEGRKAVARLLGESDGTFNFLPRTPPVMRRINVSLPDLLRECDEQIQRAQVARAALGDLAKKALFANDSVGSGPSSSDLSELARTVLSRLRSPATVDEVLEEMPAPDADVLGAIRELDAAGRIKRLSHDTERVPLVSTEALHAMRALASRAKAPGYEGAARIVFAGAPGRLAVVAHSALSLIDSVAAPDGQPTVPAPYLMANVRLGDDVSVDLVALPLVPAYSPMWPMALSGSAVVVRLDDAAAVALAEACAAAEVPVVDAGVLVPSFDEGNVALVANAVRAALERAMG